jgi:hypothetical protein
MNCHTLVDGDLRRTPGNSLLFSKNGQSPSYSMIGDLMEVIAGMAAYSEGATLHGVSSPLARYVRPTRVSQLPF